MIRSAAVVRVIEGLHTRPATSLAQLAKAYQCAIELESPAGKANMKSPVKLMLLGVKEGDEVFINADGPDESDAVPRLLAYLMDPKSGLGESEEPAAAAPAAGAAPAAAAPPAGQAAGQATTQPDNVLQGVAGSKGVAVGTPYLVFPEPLVPERQVICEDDIDAELERFRGVLEQFVSEANARAQQASTSEQTRSILRALVDVAMDEEFVGAIIRGIEGQGDAAAVVLRVGQALSEAFESMDDAYMRARSEDIRGVARKLAAQLLGVPLPDLGSISSPCVIVAADLSAWDFSSLALEHVQGLVCTGGSATSHVAIMARTYGIPAVLGVGQRQALLAQASRIVVDGDHGRAIVNPDAAQEAAALAAIAAARETAEALQRYRDVVPLTSDGREIHVCANLGALSEIQLALRAGAMGVGLFRTELLFMQHRELPSEDMQAHAYTRLAQAFFPRQVIVRTLDVGGDKPIAGLSFPAEENPFLGWRGVRMCLDRPEVFKPQLRALLRAASVGNLRVMIPMISDIEEVRSVKALIAQCRQELVDQGIEHAEFDLGIMIETPAAVLQADALAAEVAFFSIGTNDLTQYVMATDRANAQVARLYRIEHPAVMKAVDLSCRAARAAGIPVGICGEAAANLELIPKFIQMGVTELSMSPASILAAKQRIHSL